MNCGGIAARWDKTYKDAKTCCENHLWWIPEDLCVADSSEGITGFTASAAASGTGKWYIDQ